jgi:nitroimidazol reductase NimA-like FMN-containing flavoprotein (pyridoxamine 5'-phosphate oxidase superfamily)
LCRPEVSVRRKEKQIAEPQELERVLRGARYVTVAMVDGGRPYLVTLSHGYDAERSCIYFHCAPKGRKLDALRADPTVYGQALLDLGYVQGACDHLFETVQFEGRVTFVTDAAEKHCALEVMIRQLDDDPDTVIAAQTDERSVAKVTIGRIDVQSLSGKRSAKVIVQL